MKRKIIHWEKYIFLFWLVVIGVGGILLIKQKNIKYEQKAISNTKRCDYKKIYREYISKHSLYEGLKPGEYGNDKIKLIYKFDDIDGDGIPEFLYEHKHIEVVADFAHILTIKNGKVISVDKRNKKSGGAYECIGELGFVEYYPGKNIIKTVSLHGDVRYIFYYSIDHRGKLNEEASLKEALNESNEIYKSDYMVGLKSCSKKEFQKYESRIKKYKSTYMSSAEIDGEKDLTEEAFD